MATGMYDEEILDTLIEIKKLLIYILQEVRKK